MKTQEMKVLTKKEVEKLNLRVVRTPVFNGEVQVYVSGPDIPKKKRGWKGVQRSVRVDGVPRTNILL